MKYQIRKVDDNNWQLFRWQAGGETIKRGRYVGQETKAKWCPIESYHGTLDRAALALLEIATRDGVETGIEIDTETAVTAISEAREAVIAAVQAVTPDEFKKKSARGRKAKDAE